MAASLTDASVSQIERRLAELRGEGGAQRTSVLTHLAWVPPEWEDAALDVLRGLAERHPSRTILLHPDPGAKVDRCDAEVAVQVFETAERNVAAETIRIWLRGRCGEAPATVVVPLLIPDLPVFLRWRGRPPFGSGPYEQLLAVTDRLVVDSAEWPGLPAVYTALAGSFGRAAVSDLAWARTLGYRARLAELWPGIERARSLRIVGPRAEALLLCGWLRSRLGRAIGLAYEPADTLELVEVDDRSVSPPRDPPKSPSDLLSDELEVFVRDPVYERAAEGAVTLSP